MLSMKTSGMLASPRETEDEEVVEYNEEGVKARYFLVRQLGEGSAGRVVLGVPIGGGDEVAIKVIEKRPLNPVQIERVLIECRRLKRLKHPHIVPLLECIEDADRFYMVMPFIPGVDLVEHMYEHSELTPPRLAEDLCRSIFHQVFEAVQHMHENDLVHRDIKLQNILYDARRERAFVCDLGLATHAGESRGQRERAACGTLLYMAPEVVSRGKYVGPEIDVWSLGVSLFAAATGRVPFYNESPSTTIKLIRRGVFDWSPDDLTRLSPPLLALLTRMLTVDAVHRPTLSECLVDAWFRPLHVPASLPVPLPALPCRGSSGALEADEDADAQRRRLSRILRKFAPKRKGSGIKGKPAQEKDLAAVVQARVEVYLLDLDATCVIDTPPFSEPAVLDRLRREWLDGHGSGAEEVVLLENDIGDAGPRESEEEGESSVRRVLSRVEKGGGRARIEARLLPKRVVDPESVRGDMARVWARESDGGTRLQHGCVIVVDHRTGVVCSVSRGFEVALGWKEAELLGRPVACVFRTEVEGEVKYGEMFPMVLVHRSYARMPMWCVLERVDAAREAWRCSPLLVGPTEWHEQFLGGEEDMLEEVPEPTAPVERANPGQQPERGRGEPKSALPELGEDKPRALVDETGFVVKLNAAARNNARVKLAVGEHVNKLLSPESAKRLVEYLHDARSAEGAVKITASMSGMQLSIGDLFEMNKGQGSFFMAMLTLRQLSYQESVYFVISFNFF